MISRETFDDLVGAYVLDACDAAEAAAVEEYVHRNPDAATEVERLRAAAVWLAASDAIAPPSATRRFLLDRARRARPDSSASPLESYRRETTRLHAALRELDAAVADRITHNGLSVRDLVLHLAAAEQAVARELDRASITAFDDAYLRRITEIELRECANHSLGEAIDRWAEAVEQVLAITPTTDHRIAGYTVGDVLMIRAFETWTHHDDIRAVLGESESLPEPTVLRSMVEFSVRSTPWALALAGRAREVGSAALSLSGDVNGSWIVPLTPGSDPALVDPASAGATTSVVTTLTVDTLDWCKRFADRRDTEIARHVEGAPDVARDLVAAAPFFAGL